MFGKRIKCWYCNRSEKDDMVFSPTVNAHIHSRCVLSAVRNKPEDEAVKRLAAEFGLERERKEVLSARQYWENH